MLSLFFSPFLSPLLSPLNRTTAFFYQRGAMTVGFVSRQPPHKAQKPQGLRGKKTYHLCHKEQKKEELNPKAEQLSAMQLRHQSPVRNFIRKLKAAVTMRQDRSEWEEALAFQNL